MIMRYSPAFLQGYVQLQAYAAIKQRIDLQCKLPHPDRAQVGEYISRHLTYAGADHDIVTDIAIDIQVFQRNSQNG